MKNLFQIYFDNNKKCPFVVRRENWSTNYGLLVSKVIPRKTPNGWYGIAYGYGLPPLDGSPENSYFGIPGEPQEIKCSGCFQWQIVPVVPDVWLSYFKKD